MMLLKHLSMIPSVVRSFASDPTSGGGGGGGLGGLTSSSSSSSHTAGLIGLLSGARQELPGASLQSRALADTDGYSGQTPAFVTVAPAVDEDATPVFSLR